MTLSDIYANIRENSTNDYVIIGKTKSIIIVLFDSLDEVNLY